MRIRKGQAQTMNLMRLAVLASVTMLLGSGARSAPDDEPPAGYDRAAVIRMLPELHLLEPIWASQTIFRESTLPLKADDKAPILGRLAFPAEKLVEVKAADGSRSYAEGSDFQLGTDRRTLIFGAKAEVPFIKDADRYLPEGSPDSYKHRAGHPEQNMLFHQGHWFHDRQIEVTYRRTNAQWVGPVPGFAEKSLPRTLARLRAAKPLTLGVSGDSITQGYNASGFTRAVPHMPPYADLVAAQLEQHYGSPVTVKNRAISGWSISNGLADLDKLLAEKPHLVIVAYGMNDIGRRDPGWFKEQVKTFLDRVHAADPEIEVILVASMLGNAEWVHTPREMFPRYRDALAELTGPGIALADLTSLWTELLKTKDDFDLIGNGLNHPNDFGHRLYAQTILALLVAR